MSQPELSPVLPSTQPVISPPSSKPPIVSAPPSGKVMEHGIPTKNQPALLGYYYAIFGLLPIFGLFLAPAAITYGLR